MKIISVNKEPFIHLRSVIKEEIQAFINEEEYFTPKLPEVVKQNLNRYEGKNVVWYGNPDQMIVIHKDQVHGMWGNVYDQQKLNYLVDLIRDSEEKVELECSYGIGDVITLTDIKEQQESYYGGSFDVDYENLKKPSTTGDDELDKYLGTEYLDDIDEFDGIDNESLDFFSKYKTTLADNTFTVNTIRERMNTEVGDLEGIEVFIEYEESLRSAMQNNEGDIGEFRVQLRDGHHRVMAAIEAGEEYVCVNLIKEQIGKFDKYVNRVTTK